MQLNFSSIKIKRGLH